MGSTAEICRVSFDEMLRPALSTHRVYKFCATRLNKPELSDLLRQWPRINEDNLWRQRAFHVFTSEGLIMFPAKNTRLALYISRARSAITRTEPIPTLGFAVSSVYDSGHEEGTVVQFSATIATTLGPQDICLPHRKRTKTRGQSGGCGT
jgi:hypothetical protein